jgi:penicillin-binding protein 2
MSDTPKEKPKEWSLSAENVRKVVDGMYAVVNEGGTGGRARLQNIDVCGKTGSAQVASEAYEKIHKEVKDNAWFVAFAPCYKPEIVISVLWENSGLHGQYAAPIARDVMKSYFDKKIRLIEAERIRKSPASALSSALTAVAPLRNTVPTP